MAKRQATTAADGAAEDPRGSRSFWTGSISFGLVNIPVRMELAVQKKDVYFHLLHEDDHVRVKQKLICPVDKEEVSRTETVKGYELNKEQMVVVDPKELEALAPKSRRSIELLDFVALADIDSMYFDRPYYLVPERNAAKAYRLFHQALEDTDKVGIGTFVMRNRQYLAALRPLEDVICLETMYYADELVSASSLRGVPRDTGINAKELATAKQLIQTLTRNFKPEKYHDAYREAVLRLIRDKARGRKVTIQPVLPEKRADVTGILSALEASIRDARKQLGSNGNGHNGHGKHNGHNGHNGHARSAQVETSGRGTARRGPARRRKTH